MQRHEIKFARMRYEDYEMDEAIRTCCGGSGVYDDYESAGGKGGTGGTEGCDLDTITI